MDQNPGPPVLPLASDHDVSNQQTSGDDVTTENVVNNTSSDDVGDNATADPVTDVTATEHVVESTATERVIGHASITSDAPAATSVVAPDPAHLNVEHEKVEAMSSVAPEAPPPAPAPTPMDLETNVSMASNQPTQATNGGATGISAPQAEIPGLTSTPMDVEPNVSLDSRQAEQASNTDATAMSAPRAILPGLASSPMDIKPIVSDASAFAPAPEADQAVPVGNNGLDSSAMEQAGNGPAEESDDSSDSDSDSTSDDSSIWDSSDDDQPMKMPADDADVEEGDIDDILGFARGIMNDAGSVGPEAAPRTAHEEEYWKAYQKPKVTIEESDELVFLGAVKFIVDGYAVVLEQPTKDLGGVLDHPTPVFTEDRKAIGAVQEAMGLVTNPTYWFGVAGKQQAQEDGIVVGLKIFFVKRLATWVDIPMLQKEKHYDASNIHDEELSRDKQEFSDDEEEARAKKAAKNKRRNDGPPTRHDAPPAPAHRDSSYTGGTVGTGGGLNYDDEPSDGGYTKLKRPTTDSGPAASRPPAGNFQDRGGHRGRGGRGGRGGRQRPPHNRGHGHFAERPSSSHGEQGGRGGHDSHGSNGSRGGRGGSGGHGSHESAASHGVRAGYGGHGGHENQFQPNNPRDAHAHNGPYAGQPPAATYAPPPPNHYPPQPTAQYPVVPPPPQYAGNGTWIAAPPPPPPPPGALGAAYAAAPEAVGSHWYYQPGPWNQYQPPSVQQQPYPPWWGPNTRQG